MTDKPIIFSAPMIAALLAGTKTQTRRVLKPQPDQDSDPNGLRAWGAQNRYGYWRPAAKIPPYAPGDRLWVREGFALPWVRDGDAPRTCNHCTEVVYRAGHAETASRGPRDDAVWRSPIHMPRWASRLTLIVSDVRVRRLAEISENDAEAEGLYWDCTGEFSVSPREMFAALWETIHGAGSWTANPWVCALTFDVRRFNIDDAGA